ncbi:protein kinase domain-containing protein [Legionella saoudiensis]|uniref:protein kinase domain-containing protein n=1 Tax=Legionella saoudiensis TaxID=1750561 RepID=UPI0007306341|nr:protein kinase [Legionella saoudiensis]
MLTFIVGGLIVLGKILLGFAIAGISLAVIALIAHAFYSAPLPSRQKIRLRDGRIMEGPDKILGQGAFGAVHQYQLENKPVAVKMPKEANYNMLQKHELDLLKKATPHPQIIRLVGEAQVENTTWIITEFMRGSLRDLLDNLPNLSWKTKLSIAIQIVKGVMHLHNISQGFFEKKSIVHQDLKPENILVDQFKDTPNIRAKISDFGIAKEVQALTLPIIGTTLVSGVVKGTEGGTLNYSAPETAKALISGWGSAGTKCDIFSLGIILWELATGRVPRRSKEEILEGRFDEFTEEERQHRRPHTEKSFLGSVTHTTKPTYPNCGFFGPLIKSCTNPKPEKRNTAPELLAKLEKISV